MPYSYSLAVITRKLGQAFTNYCPPGGFHYGPTCAPVVAGVVNARVFEMLALLTSVPSPTDADEAELGVDANATIFTWVLKTPVLLVTQRANPTLGTVTNEHGAIDTSTVCCILAGFMGAGVKIRLFTLLPLKVTCAQTGEGLVREVTHACATIFARVLWSTKVNGQLALLAGPVWLADAHCRVCHALSVVSARRASYLAQVHNSVTRLTLPAIIAVTKWCLAAS